MTLSNTTLIDMSADVTLADSKPDFIANFEDLLENDNLV